MNNPTPARAALAHVFRSPHALCELPPDTPVLLALSGGADSRALLQLLCADAKAKGYPLHTVHLHHGIRAEEADRDAAFCRSIAEQCGVEHHALYADVPAIARQTGESCEMAGRRLRYEHFSRLMEQYHLPLLATAHHADDNMETVLLRLTTGCTTAGLGGISPARRFGCGMLVRPLLEATRQQILDFCALHSLSYVTDTTNSDPAYLRNRIRQQLSPALVQLTPHPQAHFLRACAAVREDDDYLCSLARELLTRAATPDGDLLLSVLAHAPAPLQKRALIHWLAQCRPSLRPTHAHVDALCHLIRCGRGETCLPERTSVWVEGAVLRLGSARSTALSPSRSWRVPLTDPLPPLPTPDVCVTLTPLSPDDGATFARKNAQNPQNVYNPFIYDTLSFDTIMKDAYFRPRREGDLLLLRGMHRKLRKLQNERGIPPALRERLPLLCDSQGVLWAPFVGLRDGGEALLRSQPNPTLRLTVTVSSCGTLPSKY